MKPRLRALLVERGGLITLAVLALYVWVAPPHVVNGDNAEFATLGMTGGAAHPPGYPAYLMWLRLWSWLPVESPAHAAAIATGILTTLQTLTLHAACRAWGARPTAAAVVAGLFAAGPIVLRVQSEAEVFAPHSLICALVLWLAASAGPLRGSWRVAALGLVAGLGISNQLTCVLLAPVGLLGAVRGVREATGTKPIVAAAAGVLGLALGLASYVYLLITPDTRASWGKVSDFHDLWWHFLRMDYGGPGAFAPRGVDVPMVDNLVALGRTIGRSYAWAPGLLGIGALGYFVARPTGESRPAWIVLAISWLLCGPLLASRFDVVLDDSGIYIVQRFHLMSVLVLAVPIAVALDRLAKRIEPRFERYARIIPIALPLVVFVGMTARSLPYVARFHSAAMERGFENELGTLPPDAIVFGTPDIYHFGLNYLQEAVGMRRDVLVITTPQLKLGFHRERVYQRSGVRIEPNPTQTMNVPLTEKLLATGRPVFVDAYQLSVVQAFPTYPYGVLFRVLPRGSVTPSLDEVFELNKALFAKFKFGYAQPGHHDEIASQIHNLYARVWHQLYESLRKAGETEKAEEALRRAYVLAPENDP